MTNKVWKPIDDLDGYEVSNKGDIRCWRKSGRYGGRRDSPRPVTLWSTPTMAYLIFKFVGGQKTVHREVAKAFVPNPDNLPVVNHLDNNPLNNDAKNLEWTTDRGNTVYSRGIPVKVVNPAGEILEFDSVAALARAMGCNAGNVSRFVRGIRYYNGYKSWRIYNDQ